MVCLSVSPTCLLHSLMVILATPCASVVPCPHDLGHFSRGLAGWLPRVLLPRWDAWGWRSRGWRELRYKGGPKCFQQGGSENSLLSLKK